MWCTNRNLGGNFVGWLPEKYVWSLQPVNVTRAGSTFIVFDGKHPNNKSGHASTPNAALGDWLRNNAASLGFKIVESPLSQPISLRPHEELVTQNDVQSYASRNHGSAVSAIREGRKLLDPAYIKVKSQSSRSRVVSFRVVASFPVAAASGGRRRAQLLLGSARR